MGFMVGLIYTRTKHVYQAIKHHEITSLAGIKIPRRCVSICGESAQEISGGLARASLELKAVSSELFYFR